MFWELLPLCNLVSDVVSHKMSPTLRFGYYTLAPLFIHLKKHTHVIILLVKMLNTHNKGLFSNT